MEELTAIGRLDILLKFMVIHGYDFLDIEDIWNRLPELHIEGERPQYRIQVFNKLVEDRYIQRDDYEFNKYRITFNGVLFKMRNGYLGEYQSIETKRKEDSDYKIRAERNSERLNWLTFALAAGTFLLVVWDMFKFFYSCN